MKERLVTAKDLQKMKHKLTGQLLRGMNSLEFIANNYIQYNTYGIDFFTVFDVIQSLSLDDVKTLIKDWINEEQIAICKVVPS